MNELVFIDQDINEFCIRPALAACLCTEAEISQWQRGGTSPDPWPVLWEVLNKE